MATDRLERTRANAERRKRLLRKWALRILAGCIGVALGQICERLPEEYQAPCHIAAKVSSFLGGP